VIGRSVMKKLDDTHTHSLTFPRFSTRQRDRLKELAELVMVTFWGRQKLENRKSVGLIEVTRFLHAEARVTVSADDFDDVCSKTRIER
jgi:hypothetical protein